VTTSHRAAFGFLAILASAFLFGCASVINGRTQQVWIETEPPGASVSILPAGVKIITPAQIDLDRKSVHTALATLDGHAPSIGYLDRVTSGAIYGNLLLGGLIGLMADTESGAAFRLTPDPLRITLIPLSEKPTTNSATPPP